MTDPAEPPCVVYRFRAEGPDTEEAAPGELIVGGRGKRCALDALERETPSLGAEEPVRALVLPTTFTSPTLDDMLAACILRRRLRGEALPAGLRAFADYAALVRQGLGAAELAPERSLEGVYLAVRNLDGLETADLRDPEDAERFLRGWHRLERHILGAAEEGKSPFVDRLFEEPEWARERIYLARDREVYRRDVQSGRRWVVEGLGPRASGLVLTEPRSLLFKHWCRSDREAPVGDRYLFLAVRWKAGRWVFSTDPLFRVSLAGLAATLQRAESARDAERAAADPWFDGATFDHTLIAAPRAGTELPDEELLGLVASCIEARPIDSALPAAEVAAFLVAWPIAELTTPELAWQTAAEAVFRARAGDGRRLRVHVLGVRQATPLAVDTVRGERAARDALERRLDVCDDERARCFLRFTNHRALLWRGRHLLCSVGVEDVCGTLTSWREREARPALGALLGLLVDVADALALLHGWGEVHGDLCADTVFVELEVGAVRGRLGGRRIGEPAAINFAPPVLQESGPGRDVFALAMLTVFVVRGHLEAPFRDRVNGTLSAEVFDGLDLPGLGADARWRDELCRLVLRGADFEAGRRPSAGEYGEGLRALRRELAGLATGEALPGQGSATWARGQDGVETALDVLGVAGSVAGGVCPSCAARADTDVSWCGACGAWIRLPARGEGAAREAPLDLVGRTVQGYRIERMLGRGGMGIVFLARQVRLEREVALKILPPSRSRELRLVTRFAQEARALAAIDHPHILPIFDMFEAEGVFCIAMAWARDGSVRDRLAVRGRLEPDEAAGLIRQAAAGLFAASREGIVHRDIKPDNLLLSAGRLRIADFGIACRHGDPDRDIFGTPAYMAPEQWTAFLQASHRSDLYALGCTFFELLTGTKPFPGPGWSEYRKQHLIDTAPDVRSLRPDVSAAHAAVIARLLRKNPAERTPSGAALARALA